MTGTETIQQPWTEWYEAKKTVDGAMHFVVPVMAAGNMAPASQSSQRLDLSKPKEFAGDTNASTSSQGNEGVMAAGNQAPASKDIGRPDLSKLKASEGGDKERGSRN